MLSVGYWYECWCRSEAEHKSVASESRAEENNRCMTSVLGHTVYSFDQDKETEMGEAYSKNKGEKKVKWSEGLEVE
jgi:predicted lipoprotein with Yx(FWY)xxD motif